MSAIGVKDRLGTWKTWIDDELAAIRTAGQWRSPRLLDGSGPNFIVDGRPVVSFASNDYLGLTQHPTVKAAAHDALDRLGAGTGASRLVVGSRRVHHELEDELARWKRHEAAVVLPTGYAANLAVLTTFGSGARIVSDELNHASIIDGCRLARAEVCIYRHRDVDHAEALLAGAPQGRSVLVSDTVFSMDGDLADIAALSAACARTGSLLVLDDAHAVFPTAPVDPDVELLRVGTMSKTLGSIGGFVAGTRAAVDLLVNRARSYIFSTALPAPDSAAALAALGIVGSPEGAALIARLRVAVDRLRPDHPSPIIPVVLGAEDRALAAAAALLEQGFLVPAIRPPSVAPGTSRLRVTVSAAHRDADLHAFHQALQTITKGP